MQDSGGVLEQLFIGKVGGRRGRGEKYQRRGGYGVFQPILNICLQVVPIEKPLAELLRLLAIDIVQADPGKRPIPKEKPLDGGTGNDSRSDDAKRSGKWIGGNMLRRQSGRGGSARVAD